VFTDFAETRKEFITVSGDSMAIRVKFTSSTIRGKEKRAKEVIANSELVLQNQKRKSC
jgi:hypothetical protein